MLTTNNRLSNGIIMWVELSNEGVAQVLGTCEEVMWNLSCQMEIGGRINGP